MFTHVLAFDLPIGRGQLFILVTIAVIVFFATSKRGPGHRCRRCRELNRPQAIFCAQCGLRLRSR